MSNELQFELNEHELEFLHKLHNAQALKEMTDHPGWPIFVALSSNIIERMENEHLNSAGRLDRDKYWVQGAELGGARKYARLLTESVAHQKSVLEQKFVPREPLNISELDGDL